MGVRKASKKPVRIRKRWAINPKTRVVKSKRLYKRPKNRKVLEGLYEGEGLEA